MAQQVQLPAVGPVSRRSLLLGGGAAAAVMALLWWRRRHAAAAAPAAAGDTPSSTDLAGDSSGMAGGGGALTGPSQSTSSRPTTNAQWTQLVMQQLSGVVDQNALAAALGKYLAGQAVTPDEETIIDQARAVEDDPPVAGPNGYPPAIRTQPSSGQTGGTQPPGAPTGASARPTRPTSVDIWWQPVTGAYGYTVWIRRAGSNDTWTTVGSTVAGKDSPGAGTNITAYGLTPGTAYEVVVRAENAAGYGPYSDTVHVSTPQK